MAPLTNALATPSQLYHRASFSTLPKDLQDAVFISTQCLTQAAGQLLQLPQSVTAQANVILARHWLVDSPMIEEFSATSAAALYLVAKMGPQPRSHRETANVYAYLTSEKTSMLQPRDTSDFDAKTYYLPEADYFAFRTRTVAIEARILYTISFDTHVSLPHPLAITYLQTLDFLSQSKSIISLRAVQYLNTALLSPQMLYLTHQPNALATAAIYIAARDLGAKMPRTEWWEVFDVDREELGFLVVGMRSVESSLRKLKEDNPTLFRCMITRKMVEDKMRERGIDAGTGFEQADEEQRIMSKLDGA